MAATNRRRFKKRFYPAVCLVIVPGIFTLVFGVGCAKEPEEIVTSQEAEVNPNKAEVEPSRQTGQEQKDCLWSINIQPLPNEPMSGKGWWPGKSRQGM
ncbi:MAG: hypothetical protein ACYS17_12035 [Planctomycetota bacterium]|jgi:hypothetical protein